MAPGLILATEIPSAWINHVGALARGLVEYVLIAAVEVVAITARQFILLIVVPGNAKIAATKVFTPGGAQTSAFATIIAGLRDEAVDCAAFVFTRNNVYYARHSIRTVN